MQNVRPSPFKVGDLVICKGGDKTESFWIGEVINPDAIIQRPGASSPVLPLVRVKDEERISWGVTVLYSEERKKVLETLSPAQQVYVLYKGIYSYEDDLDRAALVDALKLF